MRTPAGLCDPRCGAGPYAVVMIATIVMTEDGPAIPVPAGALSALRLRTGQRVRVDVQPLPQPSLLRTPLVEPDGFPV